MPRGSWVSPSLGAATPRGWCCGWSEGTGLPDLLPGGGSCPEAGNRSAVASSLLTPAILSGPCGVWLGWNSEKCPLHSALGPAQRQSLCPMHTGGVEPLPSGLGSCLPGSKMACIHSLIQVTCGKGSCRHHSPCKGRAAVWGVLLSAEGGRSSLRASPLRTSLGCYL